MHPGIHDIYNCNVSTTEHLNCPWNSLYAHTCITVYKIAT